MLVTNCFSLFSLMDMFNRIILRWSENYLQFYTEACIYCLALQHYPIELPFTAYVGTSYNMGITGETGYKVNVQ